MFRTSKPKNWIDRKDTPPLVLGIPTREAITGIVPGKRPADGELKGSSKFPKKEAELSWSSGAEKLQFFRILGGCVFWDGIMFIALKRWVLFEICVFLNLFFYIFSQAS